MKPLPGETLYGYIDRVHLRKPTKQPDTFKPEFIEASWVTSFNRPVLKEILK